MDANEPVSPCLGSQRQTVTRWGQDDTDDRGERRGEEEDQLTHSSADCPEGNVTFNYCTNMLSSSGKQPSETGLKFAFSPIVELTPVVGYNKFLLYSMIRI